MNEQEKDNELEELFETFDKQFEACEQKFSTIEESLKTFRAAQEDSGDATPENEHSEPQ